MRQSFRATTNDDDSGEVFMSGDGTRTVVERIVWAWLLTIPVTAVLGFVAAWLARILFG